MEATDEGGETPLRLAGAGGKAAVAAVLRRLGGWRNP